MTPALPYDAPVTDSALLSFDGRVLEVFGHVDAARYHVREEPRIEFRTGRISRLTIITKSGRKHTVLYGEPYPPPDCASWRTCWNGPGPGPRRVDMADDGVGAADPVQMSLVDRVSRWDAVTLYLSAATLCLCGPVMLGCAVFGDAELLLMGVVFTVIFLPVGHGLWFHTNLDRQHNRRGQERRRGHA